MICKERVKIYKEEVRRTYKTLEPDKALQLNATNIQLLRNYGFITAEEYHYLRAYSRSIFALID